MKTTIFTVVCLTTMTFFSTSCGSKEEEPVVQRDQVKITPSIDGMLQTRASIDPATGSGKFENGDKFSLRYLVVESGTSLQLEYTVGSTVLYWDQLTTEASHKVIFSAWYPNYNPGTTQEQITKHYYNVAGANSDLLATSVQVPYKQEVKLQFAHLMHKLVVNLASNVYTTEQLNHAEVELKNLRSHANINFGEVRINDTDAPNDPQYNLTYPKGTGAKTSFIVAPQRLIAGNQLLQITIDNKKFEFKVPSTLIKLESGKVLTLDLRVDRDAVNLTGNTITGWGTQSGIDGNATEQY